MEYDLCNICGRELDDDNTNICVSCGCSVCEEDYDSQTGFCMSCSDSYPYCGC